MNNPMFKQDEQNKLVFIKSKNIKVFPCGRRRSELVDIDANDTTVSDRYYIPFDPEARLNTEANNRKHSGLNGFKQSFIESWRENGSISFVIGGYLFKINSDYETVNSFGADVANALSSSNGKIFANIKLASMTFFTGSSTVPEASTEILRDQHANNTDKPLECLDLLNGTDKTDPDCYYFYGLSFSDTRLEDQNSPSELLGWKSLQLLDFNAETNTWIIHEASRLPKIEHGDTKNSIKIPGDLQVIGNAQIGGNMVVNNTLTASDVQIIRETENGKEELGAVTLNVRETANGLWQLRFYTK